jgi:hypothetical protein
MARKTQTQVRTVDQIIAAAPAFVARDAERACCIPMRDRGYWELMGQEFMAFFSRNEQGESKGYKWETRKVDQLCNLWVWKVA